MTQQTRARPQPARSSPPLGDPGRGHLSDLLLGVGLRLRWRRLVERHDSRFNLGLLAFVSCVASIGLMALVASLTRAPLVFPSLGPTAFLLFYRPHATVGCPRNAICGHLIGAGAGLLSLACFGLIHHGPALSHVTGVRIGAAALSLGLTAAVMIWFDTPHPPAGATTLIVSLGFLDTPAQVGVLMLGVLLLVGQGLLVNRWAGVDYPLWSPHPRHPDPGTAPAPPRRAADGSKEADVHYSIFVDAEGPCAPPSPAAFEALQTALGSPLHDFHPHQHAWTAIVDVDAVDVDQAAALVRRAVEDAERTVGLSGWGLSFWEVHQELVQIDDALPNWRPGPLPRTMHLPHPHLPHLTHGRRP